MELVKVELVNNELVFADSDKRPATDEEKRWFRNRKRLLAYKNETGEYHVVRWADIHRHSGYSLLDGCILPEVMAEKTEYAGAITDHGNMCGAVKFYNAMKKLNKLPIIGEEFYCETIDGKKSGNHLILLAKNEQGYKNLMKLSSMAYKNFYRKPHVSYEMLEMYHEGLICTSACISGEIAKNIITDNMAENNNIVQRFKKIFGKDYYIEIQRHKMENEFRINTELQFLAKSNGVKIVAATDAHYVSADDFEAHEVLLCIGTKALMSDEKRMRFTGTGYHLHTADEMEKLFEDIPEALTSTLEIAYKCKDFYIETGVYHLPDFPIPKGYKCEFDYLKKITRDGFKKRFESIFTEKEDDDEETVKQKKSQKKKYWERIKFELNVISQMGFAGYFLIVWEFINFAHENNIPTGPGRGSGAGSLVLYCLEITNIDPIKYDLLFERFLNPDRISMPDIDTDFSELEREKVLNHVTELYGTDHVAQIITFGTLAAKSVVRDVAKVYGLSAVSAANITQYIPSEPHMTINKALAMSPEFKNLMESNDLYKKVLKIARTIEGLPRNRSIHACGVCISKNEMTDYIPEIIINDDGEAVTTTQYTDCEEVGVLKMDFLGLRTLDVINSAIKLINPELKEPITQDDIPINDPKVYKFLASGHTDGVFQFESSGMTGMLKKMFSDVKSRDSSEKGDEYFERLIAAVSLYRPGPMDEIPNYLKAMKTGNIQYDHPKLESILSNTYGILTYQEQIMFAVRKLAGFTAGQSDTIRKAMGKKKMAIMDEYGKYFLYGSEEYDKEHPESPKNIKGCVNNGIDEETAKKIWDKMVKFASYAFNKSHATCYALIGAKTAWLSYYYPIEYLAGVLNSYLEDAKKLTKYINGCKERKIKIYGPDVNLSEVAFSVINEQTDKRHKYEKSIRFGLSGIKGVGKTTANSIINERNESGPYKSLEDFLQRMTRHKLDRSSLEALIYTGALDSFPGTRAAKISIFDSLLKILADIKASDENQMTLFDLCNKSKYEIIMPDVKEFGAVERAIKEDEYLGLYLNHPTELYGNKLESWANKGKLDYIENVKESLIEHDGENSIICRICGIISDLKYESKINEKKKNINILKFTVGDKTDTMRCVVFGSDAIKFSNRLKNNDIVYFLGNAKHNNFGISFIPTSAYKMSEE